jgi:hypothetical protein
VTFPLTIAAFEEHVTTTLGDNAIERLLDDAEAAIIAYAGPSIDEYVVTDMTERFRPRGPSILLSRRATDIVEVTEYAHRADPTTLAADDYALSSSGLMLRRLRDGTNPATAWHPDVDVTYSPYSDTATREVTQLELCRLEIAFNPGLASQTVGAWAEAYTANGRSYAEQRDDILARLRSADPVVIY